MEDCEWTDLKIGHHILERRTRRLGRQWRPATVRGRRRGGRCGR